MDRSAPNVLGAVRCRSFLFRRLCFALAALAGAHGPEPAGQASAAETSANSPAAQPIPNLVANGSFEKPALDERSALRQKLHLDPHLSIHHTSPDSAPILKPFGRISQTRCTAMRASGLIEFPLLRQLPPTVSVLLIKLRERRLF